MTTRNLGPESIPALQARAGITYTHDMWHIDLVPASISTQTRQYLESMKSFWRPQDGKFRVPGKWMFEDDGIENKSEPCNDHNIAVKLQHSIGALYLKSIREHLTPLNLDELHSLHHSAGQISPDFWLTRSPQIHHEEDHKGHRPVILEDPEECRGSFNMVTDILRHVGDTADCIEGALDGLPGCRLRIDPRVCYPSSFRHNAAEVKFDFVIAACPIPATRRVSKLRERFLPLTLSRPALLVGRYDLSNKDQVPAGKNLQELAAAVQPHLESLLIASDLGHKQGLSSSAVPPGQNVIFAVLQQGPAIHVIAHVPCPNTNARIAANGTYQYQYHSIVLDSIPFTPDPRTSSSTDFLIDRMRLSIAILTLQRHVSRLAEIYSTVIWPADIIDHDQDLADDCVSILSPHPSEMSIPNDFFEDLSILGKPTSIYGSGPGSELSDDMGQTIRKSTARIAEWWNRLEDEQDNPPPIDN